MPPFRLASLALVFVIAAYASPGSSLGWMPAGLPPLPATGPVLCVSNYLTPEQGQTVLDAALNRFPDAPAWEAYAAHVRMRVQEGLGLAPWPKRTPLNPIVSPPREFGGYSVQNIALETVPGFFLCANLYRPLHTPPPYPVVLSTHGHAATREAPDDYDQPGRFVRVMQARNATLARLGAMVLSIEMVGYGESADQVGAAAHRTPTVQTLQTWNSIRALDYLLSLDGADPKRVAVNGESGGATQTFLLAALDSRVTLAAPVVMVSSYFFGGCPCESGRPIHRSADHFVSNAMIAALAAPRPMLVVSDGKDWTKHVPETEFPFIKKIYDYFGEGKNVANVHLPLEGHDYGPSKREAVYRFLADHFGLSLAPALDVHGKIDESRITIEKPAAMRIFTIDAPRPARALPDIAAVDRALHALQR